MHVTLKLLPVQRWKTAVCLPSSVSTNTPQLDAEFLYLSCCVVCRAFYDEDHSFLLQGWSQEFPSARGLPLLEAQGLVVADWLVRGGLVWRRISALTLL